MYLCTFIETNFSDSKLSILEREKVVMVSVVEVHSLYLHSYKNVADDGKVIWRSYRIDKDLNTKRYEIRGQF